MAPLIFNYTPEIRAFTESLLTIYTKKEFAARKLTKTKLLELLHIISVSRQNDCLLHVLSTLHNRERKSLKEFMNSKFQQAPWHLRLCLPHGKKSFFLSGVILFHNSEFLPNSGLSKCVLKRRGHFFPIIIQRFRRLHWKPDTTTLLISSRSSIKNMEFLQNSFSCNIRKEVLV